MRVLFATVPWPTHYFGLVPIAWALQTQGHEVRVASHPSHVATVAQSGLPAVELGRDVDFMSSFQSTVGPMLLSDYSKLTPEDGEVMAEKILGIFAMIAEAQLDPLVEMCREWKPDLVVYEPAAFAGPIAAAVLGIPSARCLWGPDVTYGNTHLENSSLGPMLRRYGLDRVDTLGTITLDPCPERLQVPSELNRQRIRYIPYNGPGTMPNWLLEPPRPPRVCITWGTSTVKLGGAETFLLPYAVQAAADLGVEVVVAITAGQRELLGAVPEGVRVAESPPLHMVMPTCDAIVHQGGAGTTLTAAYYGVKQLIIPQVLDQIVNSFRVAETGAGAFFLRRGLVGDEITAPVRDALHKLLTEQSYVDGARRLQEEILAQPTPADIVPVLESLTVAQEVSR
jgi:UDP:flavonoid glycosyltransferase YjiC (YdhE family)